MYGIPRIIPPENDEMLASWIIRLASENAIDNPRSFLQSYVYPNTDIHSVILKTDYRLPFEYLWRALKFIHGRMDEISLFLNTSIFPGTAPFMLPEQRQRYLNQSFNTDRGKEPLYPLPHGVSRKLMICPECAKLEMDKKGYWYLHRAHHMPGVAVCHEHGCPLGEITTRRDRVRCAILPDYKLLQPADEYLERQYAIFAKEFLKAAPDCSLDDVKTLLDGTDKEEVISGMEGSGYNAIAGDVGYLLRVQIDGLYVDAKGLLSVLMYMYGDAVSASSALTRDDTGEAFVRELEGKGYLLESQYREDIILIRHETCGTSFCTSPFGFRTGWDCPECGRTETLQEKYHRLVEAAGNGEYKPVTDFVGMNRKAGLQHCTCGKTIYVKARSFLYERVRCDCKRRVDFREAKAEVEKYPGFKLLEYVQTNIPVLIGHTCGGAFRIHYAKFLERPRCRCCQRQGHLDIRTTDDLRQDIRDLTGSEYTLLSEYRGAREFVSIRHEICGTTQDYLPHRFLDGARCRSCLKVMSDLKFRAYVWEYSDGRYEVAGRPTKNLYRVHDTLLGTDVNIPKAKALQELQRPTPSTQLPLDKRNDTVKKDDYSGKNMFVLSVIKKTSRDGLVFMEDINPDGFTRDEVQNVFANLAKKGKILHIVTGVYALPGKEFSTESVIRKKYIERNGSRIGFLRGKCFAAEIGLEEWPGSWSIATNKESAKTANRKTTFLGQDIHIKGMPVEITDGNYLLLEVIDFLFQYRQCTDKPINEVIACIKQHIVDRNGGNLPDKSVFDNVINSYKAVNIRSYLAKLIGMIYGKDTYAKNI